MVPTSRGTELSSNYTSETGRVSTLNSDPGKGVAGAQPNCQELGHGHSHPRKGNFMGPLWGINEIVKVEALLHQL